MNRAVDRLILRGKQGLDLIVGLVDGTGAFRLVVAFAAKLQCRFGKGGPGVSVAAWRLLEELRLAGSCSVDVFITVSTILPGLE